MYFPQENMDEAWKRLASSATSEVYRESLPLNEKFNITEQSIIIQEGREGKGMRKEGGKRKLRVRGKMKESGCLKDKCRGRGKRMENPLKK